MSPAPFLSTTALSSSPTTFTQRRRKITAINAFEALVLTYTLGPIFLGMLFLVALTIYNRGFGRRLRDPERPWGLKSEWKKERRSCLFRWGKEGKGKGDGREYTQINKLNNLTRILKRVLRSKQICFFFGLVLFEKQTDTSLLLDIPCITVC